MSWKTSLYKYTKMLLETPEILVLFPWLQFSSFTQSCLTLRPHELQHSRPPCSSTNGRVYPNPWPLSQWWHPTISSSVVSFSSCPQSLPASGLFKWVSFSHQVAKLLEFRFNISPSNEHSGLISFRMDWLDFLAVQGTLKSLLQHHSSKSSILQCSAFFTVQIAHPYMTTGKTIALTRPVLAK